MESSNPILKAETFTGTAATEARAMTLAGTVNKSAILLLIAATSAAWTFLSYSRGGAIGPWLALGLVGGLVVGLVTVLRMEWAPLTAPLYALFEGLALGGLSALVDAVYPGVAFQAVGLSLGTMLGVLAAYRSGLIKATEGFKRGVLAATGAIAVVYLATLVLGFFGADVPCVHSGGFIGIGVSGLVIVVAALNFILDFDLIAEGVRAGAPRHMEWYAAFSLLVTLIWLYVEIVRLLMAIAEALGDD